MKKVLENKGILGILLRNTIRKEREILDFEDGEVISCILNSDTGCLGNVPLWESNVDSVCILNNVVVCHNESGRGDQEPTSTALELGVPARSRLACDWRIRLDK